MKKLLLLILIFAGIQFSNRINSQVLTIDTSSPSMCDGYAYIDTVNVVANNPIWAGNGVVLQNGGNSISNLCPGTYTITYVDFLGNTYSYTFTIGSGGVNPCSGFTAAITTADAISALSCDGIAVADVWGGTAPYTYLWDNGSTTISQSNLCTGIYTCFITDANGCSVSANGAVNNGANAIDSILIFINNSYPGNGIVDTLGTNWIEDCSIDYGSVGSASITNYFYLNVDTVIVTWTLVDTNGVIVSVYDVPTVIVNPAAGVFSTSLVVFCSQKSTNYNTIQITDQILLDQSQMGIMENYIAEFTVVNPFNDIIQVALNDNSTGRIVLLDMNGRSVLEGNFNNESSINLNTNNVQSGIYILKVEIDGILFTRKLMK